MARQSVDQLAAQVEALQNVLRQHGIIQDVAPVDTTDLPDHIPHGSGRHAQFLGLVEMQDGDDTPHLAEYTSPGTGRRFRLEDELGSVRYAPGMPMDKAAAIILRQKVNELETAPTVPADAPPMFQPGPVYA